MDNVDGTSSPNATPENWHVQLPTGELRVMTLDQLDEAFQEGTINEDTHVLQVGGTVWSKLGAIAGIEDEAAPANPTAGPANGATAGEVAVEPAPVTVTAATLEAAAPIDAPYAFPATRAHDEIPPPAPHAVYASPAAAPSDVGRSDSAPSPVVTLPVIAAPTLADAPRYDLPSSLPSLRPVVSEVDFDEIPAQFRSKKRGFVIAAVAVTLLGGVAVAAVTLGGSLSSSSAAAPSVAAPPAVAAVAAPPAPATTPIPELAANTLPSAPKEARLSDAQRRVLLDADKSRAAKQKARAATPRHAARKSGGTPFHAGGSPGDPLNSSL